MPARTPGIPVVVGPTGIGKTRLAIELAAYLNGEIVVADSRQVYSDLHIATNHPDHYERRRARFHLIEVADPRSSYSVHQYVRDASAAIGRILERGRQPILEGGTGLYVDALMDGFNLAGVPPNPERRRQLEEKTTPELASHLLALDPGAVVDFQNRVRLVRAIEIVETSSAPLAAHRQRTAPAWRAVRIGLTAPAQVIESRLEARVARQLERGLIAETKAALGAGVSRGAPVLTGIGYADTVRYLGGELTFDQLVEALGRSNRRYARRQLTWWRRDARVRWFDVDPDPLPSILRYLENAAITP
jgi:tRNA dimethylallyltransferase